MTGIPSLQSIHFPSLLLFLFHLNLFFFDQALSRVCSFELYCVSESADFKNFFNSILGSLIYCFSNFWICCCYLLSISSLFFRIMGLGLIFLFMSDYEIILFSINSSHQFSYFVYFQTWYFIHYWAFLYFKKNYLRQTYFINSLSEMFENFKREIDYFKWNFMLYLNYFSCFKLSFIFRNVYFSNHMNFKSSQY